MARRLSTCFPGPLPVPIHVCTDLTGVGRASTQSTPRGLGIQPSGENHKAWVPDTVKLLLPTKWQVRGPGSGTARGSHFLVYFIVEFCLFVCFFRAETPVCIILQSATFKGHFIPGTWNSIWVCHMVQGPKLLVPSSSSATFPAPSQGAG